MFAGLGGYQHHLSQLRNAQRAELQDQLAAQVAERQQQLAAARQQRLRRDSWEEQRAKKGQAELSSRYYPERKEEQGALNRPGVPAEFLPSKVNLGRTILDTWSAAEKPQRRPRPIVMQSREARSAEPVKLRDSGPIQIPFVSSFQTAITRLGSMQQEHMDVLDKEMQRLRERVLENRMGLRQIVESKPPNPPADACKRAVHEMDKLGFPDLSGTLPSHSVFQPIGLPLKTPEKTKRSPSRELSPDSSSWKRSGSFSSTPKEERQKRSPSRERSPDSGSWKRSGSFNSSLKDQLLLSDLSPFNTLSEYSRSPQRELRSPTSPLARLMSMDVVPLDKVIRQSIDIF